MNSRERMLPQISHSGPRYIRWSRMPAEALIRERIKHRTMQSAPNGTPISFGASGRRRFSLLLFSAEYLIHMWCRTHPMWPIASRSIRGGQSGRFWAVSDFRFWIVSGNIKCVGETTKCQKRLRTRNDAGPTLELLQPPETVSALSFLVRFFSLFPFQN